MSERSKIEGLLNDIVAYQGLINTGVSGIGSAHSEDLQLARTIYVDSMVTASGNGLSRATAVKTIEEALDLADLTNKTDLILIYDDPGGSGYDIDRPTATATWSSPVVIKGVGRQQVMICNENVGADHVLKFEDAVYLSNVKIVVDGERSQIGVIVSEGHSDGSEIIRVDFDFLNAGSGSVGIQLLLNERSLVEKCHFYINGKNALMIEGVQVAGSLRCDIRDNIFDGSHGSVPGGIGVHFIATGTACRQNYVRDNLFYNCDHGGLIDVNCNQNGFIGNTFKASIVADVTDNGTANYEISSVTQV